MINTEDLEKDADGKIITRPIMGFSTAPIADISIFLRVRYAETPEELKTEGKAIQFAMTPDQALSLAEMMTTQARQILDQKPSTPTN